MHATGNILGSTRSGIGKGRLLLCYSRVLQHLRRDDNVSEVIVYEGKDYVIFFFLSGSDFCEVFNAIIRFVLSMVFV